MFGQPHVRAVPSAVAFSHDHHNVLILVSDPGGGTALSATTARRRARAEAPRTSRSRHRRGRISPNEVGSAALYETVVLVPARNEEVGVFTSLQSLAAQSRRP